jgi:hypothetical protein
MSEQIPFRPKEVLQQDGENKGAYKDIRLAYKEANEVNDRLKEGYSQEQAQRFGNDAGKKELETRVSAELLDGSGFGNETNKTAEMEAAKTISAQNDLIATRHGERIPGILEAIDGFLASAIRTANEEGKDSESYSLSKVAKELGLSKSELTNALQVMDRSKVTGISRISGISGDEDSFNIQFDGGEK